jgi:phosphoribosylformylglycinamidine synthase
LLGTFTDSGFLDITFGDETVAMLDMEFLHEGDPDLDLSAVWEPRRFDEPLGPPPDDLGATLLAMLGRLNLASNEEKARHYDHEVKGLTVVKPWAGASADVPAEATVFLVRHGSPRGYILSEGVNPFYSDIDTYAMAQSVLDEAVRRSHHRAMQLLEGNGLLSSDAFKVENGTVTLNLILRPTGEFTEECFVVANVVRLVEVG